MAAPVAVAPTRDAAAARGSRGPASAPAWPSSDDGRRRYDDLAVARRPGIAAPSTRTTSSTIRGSHRAQPSTRTLDCPDNVASSAFGEDHGPSLAIWTVDGISDLIAGASQWTATACQSGAAFVTAGRRRPAETPTYPLASPAAMRPAPPRFRRLDAGDADGDGDPISPVAETFPRSHRHRSGTRSAVSGRSAVVHRADGLWDGAAQASVWFGSALAR
jgi:hypothetical protein